MQFEAKLERQPGQTTIEKFGLSGEIFFNRNGGYVFSEAATQVTV
jgi:hypothetical protein